VNIEKFDLPPGTVVRICEESDAQYQHGWRLIAIVPWKGRQLESEQQPNGLMIPVWRDVGSVRYVLAQDENETVAEAQRAALGAQSDLAVERSDRVAAEAALEQEKKVSAKAIADFERANQFLIGKTRVLQIAEDAKHKMEADISKLRDALGDLRMREILEGK